MEVYIVRYLHREITEDELRELETWLNETQANRDEFFDLKNIHDLMKRKLPDEGETTRSWHRICRKITMLSASTAALETPVRKIILLNALKYAALVIAAVATGFVASEYFGDRFHQAEKIHPVEYSEVCVGKGSRPNTVNLSDGSVARLNTATTMRYLSGFSDSTREVFLDGEAFFEIAPNEDKPFVVHLKQQTVTVHGTNFNVEAYHDESCNAVTLLEGSVSIESVDVNGVKINDVRLVPGQKVSFDRAAGKVSVLQVDASLSNTWIQGEYRFRDESLMRIFKKLENYYGVSINLEDEQLKNIRYTGTFSLHQHIREVLRIINHENLFRFQQSGNEIYIKRK
jgi:ferric-dicitrate binding protein FerR (iron transport regulator)